MPFSSPSQGLIGLPRSCGRRAARCLAVAVLLATLTGAWAPWAPARAQVPLDLDLNRRAVADSTLPWGWNLWPHLQSGYTVQLLHGEESDSAPALRISTKEPLPRVTAVYRISHPLGAGRRVAFSALASAEPSAEAYLGIVARDIVAGQFVIVAADTLARIGTDLDRVVAEIEVPAEADMVDLWVTRAGAGTSDISELRLTVDGEPAAYRAASVTPPTGLVDSVRALALDWGDGHALQAPMELPGLSALVGSARVLLLGETTHGTREFFEMRLRVVEHLAETDSRVIVALEDHLTAGLELNEYVQGRSTDLQEAMTGLFEIYQRKAFISFVDRLRRINRDTPGRIEVWGVDMQNPVPAMDRIAAGLASSDTEMALAVNERFAPILEGWHSGGTAPADTLNEWREIAVGVEESLRDADPLIQRLARVVTQAVELRQAGRQDPRDAFMAENLRWILAHRAPDRMVFWGHAGHTRLSPGGMGNHLRADLGPDVLSIALLTHRGSYTASWPREGRWHPGSFSLFPAPSRSLEFLLHEGGIRLGALDLRPFRTNSGDAWLENDLEMRSIGAVPVDYGFVPTAPARSFDAVFFIDRTRAARPLD